jgi:hypothetical protein
MVHKNLGDTGDYECADSLDRLRLEINIGKDFCYRPSSTRSRNQRAV